MQSRTAILHLARFLLVASLLVPAFAQAQDAIGRIIQTSGVVTAVNAAGAERRIARGSEVFIGETITTGPRGASQLRLSDGAVISLEADTFFSVDEYEYDGAGGAADTTIMTMARGTMRTLTGTIGEDPTDTYELNTPFASIGVRGTEYAVVVDTTGRVRVFVFDGSVSVAPPTGGGAPTIVGIGGQADNVEVADDATVTEIALEDVPSEVVNVIASMVTETISDDEVARLPPSEVATEVQRRVEQRQNEEQSESIRSQQPGARDSAGTNVDASGRVLVATTEDELVEARTVVVISVSEEDPDAFDVRTRVTASPSQP